MMVTFADTRTGNRLDDPFEELLSRFAVLTSDHFEPAKAQTLERPFRGQDSAADGTNGAERPTSGEWIDDEADQLRGQTSAETPDRAMLWLEVTADEGELAAFVRLANAINWQQRSAEAFARAVQLALKVGAHLTARKLALTAAQRFPEHAELAKAARILAPPVARVVASEQGANWTGNMEWLQAHRAEYEGRWVALRSGSLVTTAGSLADLLAQVGDPREQDILVTKVW